MGSIVQKRSSIRLSRSSATSICCSFGRQDGSGRNWRSCHHPEPTHQPKFSLEGVPSPPEASYDRPVARPVSCITVELRFDPTDRPQNHGEAEQVSANGMVRPCCPDGQGHRGFSFGTISSGGIAPPHCSCDAPAPAGAAETLALASAAPDLLAVSMVLPPDEPRAPPAGRVRRSLSEDNRYQSHS